MPGGSCAATWAIRSVTNCLARQNSVSMSNSTTTEDRPCVVCERIRRTPGRPFIADSIGRVIIISISSGGHRLVLGDDGEDRDGDVRVDVPRHLLVGR